MSFLPLETEADLQEAVEASYTAPVFIFKHSAACPISSSAQASLNALAAPAAQPVYRLVVQHVRSLSNLIAQRFGIRHESPQLLILRHGQVQAHTSHYQVTADWARKHAEATV